jgi:hypothetical protein
MLLFELCETDDFAGDRDRVRVWCADEVEKVATPADARGPVGTPGANTAVLDLWVYSARGPSGAPGMTFCKGR